MKHVILVVLSLSISQFCISQIFNQDAQGKSTIIGLGGTINIDLKESLFKANYYKTSKKTKSLILGFDVQGKNNEGLVGLFKDGDFSPSGEASTLIGGKHSWQRGFPNKTSTLLYYLRVGIKGTEFKYDKGNAFMTLKSRFVDTSHITHKIEIGATLRSGGHLNLGFLIGNSYENNQGSLNKSVYKYVSNDLNITGLQQTKDITAYQGNYGKFSNTYIDFDALYFLKVDTVYVIPSIYFRYNISSNKTLQENNGVIGLSLNFVNLNSGKFFGGVYVQNNDLFNNMKIFDLYKKIQFGLVARFSLTTIGTL